MENSLNMEELMAILSAKRDADYEIKKFQAALKGVDLDKESAKANTAQDFDSFREQVMAKHNQVNTNDISSLQHASQKEGIFLDDNGELRIT